MTIRYLEHSVEIRSTSPTGKVTGKSSGGATCLLGDDLQGTMSWEELADLALAELPADHQRAVREACRERTGEKNGKASG